MKEKKKTRLAPLKAVDLWGEMAIMCFCRPSWKDRNTASDSNYRPYDSWDIWYNQGRSERVIISKQGFLTERPPRSGEVERRHNKGVLKTSIMSFWSDVIAGAVLLTSAVCFFCFFLPIRSISATVNQAVRMITETTGIRTGLETATRWNDKRQTEGI